MIGTLLRIALAVAVAYLLLRIGFAMLRAFAVPTPQPPPPGEMRKVNLRYRCSICGAELRMTLAADELPESPRHCMEEMELTAGPDDD